MLWKVALALKKSSRQNKHHRTAKISPGNPFSYEPDLLITSKSSFLCVFQHDSGGKGNRLFWSGLSRIGRLGKRGRYSENLQRSLTLAGRLI